MVFTVAIIDYYDNCGDIALIFLIVLLIFWHKGNLKAKKAPGGFVTVANVHFTNHSFFFKYQPDQPSFFPTIVFKYQPCILATVMVCLLQVFLKWDKCEIPEEYLTKWPIKSKWKKVIKSSLLFFFWPLCVMFVFSKSKTLVQPNLLICVHFFDSSLPIVFLEPQKYFRMSFEDILKTLQHTVFYNTLFFPNWWFLRE